MIKYYGMLYAKMGRKYIPTGRTAADWDLMESAIKSQSSIVCRLESSHLIAAAPDLLAALKLAATTKEPDDKIERMIWMGRQQIILAAISKAEGVK